MNTKDTNINDVNFKKLLHNDAYYKHIFKKTEKIVSVVFYILNNVDSNKRSETHVSNVASKAHFVHDHALRTLEVRLTSSQEVLEQFAQALVGLDSTLRVAASVGLITQDVLYVVINEIDTVLRGLNSYLSSESSVNETLFGNTSAVKLRAGSEQQASSTSERGTVSVAKKHSSEQASPADRRERIKTILEAKGEATIKDISEIVTDCSEKTIQRELNTMIGDNVVKRRGERRWSKYSIF